MPRIDTRSGSARLLDFLPDQVLPRKTLLALSGDRSKARLPFFGASGLRKRVAAAWQKPLDQISCGECRMLAGQRFGLQWLAVPIATFVARYPRAECDLYPGDLSVNALNAWRELHRYAPDAVVAMLRADFGWLDRAMTKDPSGGLLAEARAGLEAARGELGL